MPKIKITIGGHDHEIDDMNFIAVEMAWPFIEQAMATEHPVAGTNAALAVVAAAMMETPGFDASKFDVEVTGKDDAGVEWPRAEVLIHIDMTNVLRRRLKAREMGAVKLVLYELIESAGFEIGASGEVSPGEAVANLSPETVINTSPSSSQLESKEVAGTA